MREELVTPATARRLAQEGLAWDPQPGDWVTSLGGAYMDEGLVGLWLVVNASPDGQLMLADATGRWPQSRGQARDCLWLPSAGKLKVWLRGRGYRVATGEVTARMLGGEGSTTHHVCRLTRAGGGPPVDGEGINEAEAVAAAALQAIGAGTSDSPRAW